MKNKLGFTLLEIVIILGILSILSVGVFVSIRGGSSERRALQNASLALQADIRYAQRRSIIEGRRYGVIFELVNNRYRVVSDMPRRTIRTVYMENGVTLLFISGGHNQVFFTGRGTPTHSFTILLITNSFMQQLTIVPSGGRVRVSDITRR
jgi:Tfp pilus assembly protein FimT